MQLIGVGAGGHVKMLLEVLLLDPAMEVVGLVDANPALVGTGVLGVPVLGGDELLASFVQQGIRGAFIGIGAVGNLQARRNIYDRLCDLGFRVVPVVHKSAIISRSATVGDGVTILPLAVVNACATIGRNVLLNTGAIVEHDCRVGDHAHIATGAHLAGGVVIGDAAHVGIGATVKQGVRIGAGAIVGAGAVVIGDVEPLATVVGVPARVREQHIQP